ncbi:alpha/beta fold hydrolase [Corynebacterium sp. H78]|uniref:alpha/beta fold hydrolase n=1 Tax=Corynebacterium sp. H78 TaxID=3133417 RepID=UPI0030A65872
MASFSDDLLLPGPWSHRMVHVRGQRLHVAECGAMSDPMVLFLHGSTGGWFEWRRVLALLADDPFHAVAPSMRGYAPSDRTPNGYSPVIAAEDAAGLIRAMGHTKAIVVGHGLGSWIAWTLAARHPQLIDSLILSGAVHPRAWVAEMKSKPWSRESRTIVGSTLRRTGRQSFPSRIGRRLLGPSTSNEQRIEDVVTHSMARTGITPEGANFADTELGAETADLMRLSLASGALSTALQHADWWTKPWPPRLVRWLAELNQAGLPEAQLIAGELDQSTPKRLLEASLSPETLQRAQLIAGGGQDVANPLLLPNIGHFPPVEAPEVIAEAIGTAMETFEH